MGFAHSSIRAPARILSCRAQRGILLSTQSLQQACAPASLRSPCRVPHPALLCAGWDSHIPQSERQRGSVMPSAARYPYSLLNLSSKPEIPLWVPHPALLCAGWDSHIPQSERQRGICHTERSEVSLPASQSLPAKGFEPQPRHSDKARLSNPSASEDSVMPSAARDPTLYSISPASLRSPCGCPPPCASLRWVGFAHSSIRAPARICHTERSEDLTINLSSKPEIPLRVPHPALLCAWVGFAHSSIRAPARNCHTERSEVSLFPPATGVANLSIPQVFTEIAVTLSLHCRNKFRESV